MHCAHCNAAIGPLVFVGRRDECEACRGDLHICKHCLFFDERAPRQCREPVAEPPRDKGVANFCDYFKWAGSIAANDNAATALSAAEALFSKK